MPIFTATAPASAPPPAPPAAPAAAGQPPAASMRADAGRGLQRPGRPHQHDPRAERPAGEVVPDQPGASARDRGHPPPPPGREASVGADVIDASFLAPDCNRSSPVRCSSHETREPGPARKSAFSAYQVATCKKLYKRVACRRARLVFTRRGGSASSADSVRQIHAVRAHRPRWDGRRVQGTRAGPRRVRARLRRQADPAAPSDDPQFTRMFIEEAKLSARLNHPNIVQVFELGAVDKEYFIAMEYVQGPRPGRDHAHPLGARRPAAPRAGGLRRPRDVPRPGLRPRSDRRRRRAAGHDPPRRLALERDAVVRGRGQAARLRHRQGAGRRSSVDEGNTQRGTLKGKFAYMAPEQTAGNDVDKRIDIFASGIVLHEVLTGRRLFKGENDLQTVERVRQCEVAPPSVHNPLCPPELDGIILRALARNRDERFQTSSEMADALDDVVHAARFQPTHLAMLMRELFPTEAGGTGVNRVAGSMPGSQSRPHSTMRSPTVPPLSIPRSPPPTRPSLPRLGHVPTPPPRRSFLARGLDLGRAGPGGAGRRRRARWSAARPPTRDLQGTAPGIETTAPAEEVLHPGQLDPRRRRDLRLRREPVPRHHRHHPPLRGQGRRAPSLLFKKEGYHDEIREVNPYSILVTLRPLENAGATKARRARRPAPGATAAPPRRRRPRRRPPAPSSGTTPPRPAAAPSSCRPPPRRRPRPAARPRPPAPRAATAPASSSTPTRSPTPSESPPPRPG